MKINALIVITLRSRRSWSQEELATASGLNLRTLQRVLTGKPADTVAASLTREGEQGWRLREMRPRARSQDAACRLKPRAKRRVSKGWYRYGDSNPGPVAENHVS